MNRDAMEQPIPPLLAALALWGWQTGLWPWALGMGLLIEAARFSRLRWELGQGDFNRLWNFTILLFLGVGLYLFLARQGLGTVGSLVSAGSPGDRLDGMRQLSQTAILFLRGLPFVLFVFVLVHAWSRSTTLPWSTFSLYLRARRSREGEEGRVHPGYLYFGLVLFSSCAAAANPVLYPVLLVGVVAWGLWPWRNRRFGAPVWVGLLVVLLGSMLMMQRGVVAMREVLQALENRWLQRAAEERFDQLDSFTALGAVGRIKQSGRIVLRVRAEGETPPGLLREAAFNRFRGNHWGSVHREFQPVTAALDGLLWRFSAERRVGRVLEVSRYTVDGEAPLALPGQTLAVRDLPALSIETNHLAAARMQGAPPLANYTVDYGSGGGFDGPPGDEDLELSQLAAPEQEVIREVAAELRLAGQSGQEAVATVARYFTTGFEYSLWQGWNRSATNASALVSFLREWRSGHCEYYATATVLLLRAAGVPTRYAVGYSVDEQRGDHWLARGRDAHAWCLAYVEGRWQDVDTTPGDWRKREMALAGWWEGLGDWMSDAWYRFALWRQQGGNWRIYVFALSMFALSWLAWRQLRGSRWRRTRVGQPASGRVEPWPGLDSEFYAVIRQLERAHGERAGHETLRRWFQRLGLSGSRGSEAMFEALRLHDRLRFDPRGLTAGERERLRELVRLRLTSPGTVLKGGPR
ncbi:MAG: transglutaminase-like domain-containing protein [Verrucomicrobia bacterium]|nr:transglutaminase-like domain-containing protein [Verrucomicrobiota bacterium]